ncbi:MAG: hypothetical protein U0Q16_25485 [Bryobacteraceae bacterium]
MSVLVQFGKRKAILRTGRWLSADLGLERRLNDGTVEWIRSTGGPPVSEKDQERTVAAEMATQFGGRIALYLQSQSGDSEKFFLEHRQLSFAFDSFITLTNKPPAKRVAAKKKGKKRAAGGR